MPPPTIRNCPHCMGDLNYNGMGLYDCDECKAEFFIRPMRDPEVQVYDADTNDPL